MKISVISFTRAGAAKNLEVVGILQEKKHQAASFSWHKYTGRKLIPFQKLDQLLTDLWDKQDAFVFLTDTETAMRAVIPFLSDPKKGPAVFVMDERGQFVLTLVNGSFAGAQDWCRQFAQMVNAVGVVTGNAAAEELFSMDAFAQNNHLQVQDVYRIRAVKEALAAGEPVGIYSDYPIEGVLPEGFVALGKLAGMMQTAMPGVSPEVLQHMAHKGFQSGAASDKTPVPEVGISITDDWEAPRFAKECRMYPKNLVMAIYCDKGKTMEELEYFVKNALTDARLSRKRIQTVFSLEEKAQEQGILQLADRWGIPFFTYSAKQLAGKDRQRTDVTSGLPLSILCDRCALLGSRQGDLRIAHKMADGMMVSVCEQAVELTF